MTGTSIAPGIKLRARGSISNPAGRYEAQTRQYDPDSGDPDEDGSPARTQVTFERPRRMISYNRSPDLPFDRSINPYRGCEHGCVYCFARPTHAWLGLSPGLDFETRLIARPAAPEVLEAELRARCYACAPIAIGTNTDPYQPIEKEHGITRACLEVLRSFRHPVAIVTKGTLIERDIDILADLAHQGLVRVGISMTTLDARLARRLEPRAPAPERRLKTISRLTTAGVPVRMMIAPVIPALTDHELEALLEAGAQAGMCGASWVMLRLPLEVSALFQEWLATHYPDRAGRVMKHLREMHGGKEYDAAWGKRMRGTGAYAKIIAQRFDKAIKRIGVDQPLPVLRADLFRPPLMAGEQLSLL